MSGQDASGNALEYAIARQVACAAGVLIQEDSVSEKARQDFMSESPDTRRQLALVADATVKHVFALEQTRLTLDKTSAVIMQPDSQGQVGDPRDIVLPLKKGELGLSVKRNNNTFKNPRLQRNNPDFFAKWGLQGEASKDYCNRVEKIFMKLDEAHEKGVKNWRNLSEVGVDLHNDIFEPLVLDFIAEFRKGMNSENCAHFVGYMLGNVDYYKIIAYIGKRAIVQGINFKKSLSCGAALFPKELISAKKLLPNTAILTFGGGWTYTMRIHNAVSKLENSLKWDVKLIAHPVEMYTHHIIL